MAETRDIAAQDARAAAQIEADVGVEHLANVYAKALLGATEHAGQTAAVIDEFDDLLADLLDRFPKAGGDSGVGIGFAGGEVAASSTGCWPAGPRRYWSIS